MAAEVPPAEAHRHITFNTDTKNHNAPPTKKKKSNIITHFLNKHHVGYLPGEIQNPQYQPGHFIEFTNNSGTHYFIVKKAPAGSLNKKILEPLNQAAKNGIQRVNIFNAKFAAAESAAAANAAHPAANAPANNGTQPLEGGRRRKHRSRKHKNHRKNRRTRKH